MSKNESTVRVTHTEKVKISMEIKLWPHTWKTDFAKYLEANKNPYNLPMDVFASLYTAIGNCVEKYKTLFYISKEVFEHLKAVRVIMNSQVLSPEFIILENGDDEIYASFTLNW